MNKPVIRWKPVPQEDPSDRSRTLYIPQIVERNQTKTLTDVVYSAIDRGLIAGLKTSAAQSIAEGVLAQLGEDLNSAHGVIFGDYFSVRAYLAGTVDGMFGALGAANKLNARFVPGNALRLDRRNFSFRNVLETGDAPVIDEVQGEYDGALVGEFKAGEDVQLIGSNLKLAEGDRLHIYIVNAQGGERLVKTVESPADFTQNSNRVLTLGAAALPAVMANTRYGFKLEKTMDVDGVAAVISSNEQYATAIDGSGPEPGPEPLAQTSDGKCKIMSMDDEGSHTDFLYGSAWNVNGTGIYGDRAAPGGEWEIARCSVSVDGSDYTLAGNFNEDGAHGEISPLGGDTPARGTYHDIELSLVASRGTESETLTITLPTFIVE